MADAIIERFPFGQPVLVVDQQDRGRKRAFVLGVYASAVHARWYSASGRLLVNALAVASEPEIFWRGENASEVVSRIDVTPANGFLVPADDRFNGPSGRALDRLFLYPLRLTRADCWLCDLLPQSRMNPGQARAIKRRYQPLVKRGVAPAVLWSSVPRTFADDARRAAICAELKASGAELLVLLGDRPVQEFLSAYHQAKDLRTLTDGGRTYGRSFEVSIDGYSTSVLPLVHPRQAARLGRSSTEWGKHHANWVRRSLTSR